MALTIDGSDPSGDLGDLLDAKLNLAGGKILQVVRATDATQRSTTSTSFVDASISVTITPQKSTSAILLIWSAAIQVSSATQPVEMKTQITDSSNNALSGASASFFGVSGVNAANPATQNILIGYSTPATTSAVTYKGRFGTARATDTASLQVAAVDGQLYAIEVSA